MIKHIVFFKLKDKTDGSLEKLVGVLEGLKDKIDVLVDAEVGVNFTESDRAMDIYLSTTFKTKEDLKTYATHPDHLPVLKLVSEVCEMSKVVDCVL